MQSCRALVLGVLSCCACGSSAVHRPAQSFAGLARVSGQSPFAAGCGGTGQRGNNYRSAEVEPFVAVDPHDPLHLVGVWQQDRWSNGGSNGLGSGVSFDGGKTWTTGFLPFTTCSGGTVANRLNFERATDPWITFGADSTAHQIAYAFDNTDARSAMLAARSPDGGRTWSAPIFLYEENNPDTAIDKESITADPGDAHLVYAVWDRLTGVLDPASPNGTGPAWFTRTTDGGASWETARSIYDPGLNAQTIGNQIVVLPDGTLVNLMTVITQLNQQSQPAAAAVLRSTDKGLTWSQPIRIAAETSQGVLDPKTNHPVRTGDVVASIAVDPQSGALYVAWEDSRFTSRDGIALSSSLDGGLTWSAPVRVNGAPSSQAFTPALAVAPGGKVGVTYYDLRNDDPHDDSVLLATAWLAISSDGGKTFQESALGGPFDLRSAALTSDGYFVGDYQGLVASGADFLPFLAIANDGNASNRSDIFAHPPGGVAVAGLVARPTALVEERAFSVRRQPRSGQRRSY